VIQEILHSILGLGEDFGEDLSEGGDGREVVFLLGSDLPEGGVESVGVERVGSERVVGIWRRRRRAEGDEDREKRRKSQRRRRRETNERKGKMRLTLRQFSVVAQGKLSSTEGVSVDEDHASRVEFEEIVDEGDDHDDGCWRSGEGESTESFDDGRDESGREMAARRERFGIVSMHLEDRTE